MIPRRTLLVSALAAAGCASMRDPAPGPFRVGDGLSVQLDRTWSDFTPPGARKLRLLSQNGPTLDRLYLVGGLEDGEGLANRQRGAAVFNATSADEDLSAFIAASVDALGYIAPVVSNHRPARFGAATGWRIDIATATGDGLAFSSSALYARHNGRLSVILYLAATEHYFAAGLPGAEAIMASAALR